MISDEIRKLILSLIPQVPSLRCLAPLLQLQEQMPTAQAVEELLRSQHRLHETLTAALQRLRPGRREHDLSCTIGRHLLG